jgi:hypothetical protein
MQKLNQQDSVVATPKTAIQESKKDVFKPQAGLKDSTNNVLGDDKQNREGKDVVAKIVPDTKQTEKLFNIKDLTTNLTPKKITTLVAIIFMALLIVGALYVKFIRRTPIRNTPVLINVPSPTYSPYQKYKPSIYAQDSNFKKIDEGINVLGNEVKNTSLEESTLLPPSLDFNVNLKQ